MNNPIQKYKIGLVVVFVFVLGLAIYAGLQAGTARQDNETYKKATKIAEKLNSYTVRKPPPKSLSQLDVQDVPDTIRYERLSDFKYKFCVTYKADSSGFDAGSVQTQLLTSAYGDTYDNSDYESSYLYLSPTHKKGENCQTIKIYTDTYGDNYRNGTSLCKYDSSYTDEEYQTYIDCLDAESQSDNDD